MESTSYLMAADATACLHLAYAGIIVIGLLLVLWGGLRRWHWVRSRSLRMVHLAMILVVVVESLLSVECPLTTLERWLRSAAGEPFDSGGAIATFVHKVLFYDLPPWAFTSIYIGIGTLILATLWLVPPRRSGADASFDIT